MTVMKRLVVLALGLSCWATACAPPLPKPQANTGADSLAEPLLPLSSLADHCMLIRRDERVHAAEIILRCIDRPDVSVESSATLEGAVTVRTPNQALEFARLLSSRQACGFGVHSSWVEVAATREDEWLGLRESDFHRLCGSTTPGAQASPSDERTFLVNRCLLSLDSGDLFRVVEEVTSGGKLRQLSQDLVLPNANRRVGWCQPGPR